MRRCTIMNTAHYWHALNDGSGKLQCDLCPRFCKIAPGGRGLCYVRGNEQDQIQLLNDYRSSGFCIDPIEKKPLNHFLPGTPVLSFGTAGCNLACKFCQNWDISKSREQDTLSQQARPEAIAEAAHQAGCRSVAYTYNDPVIFFEYALETAAACREKQLNNVAVTAGYICDEPREPFFAAMDAVNVDLKAFTERFYWKICGGHLQPVLETLKYIYHETHCWLEITTLLIPGENDSDNELHQLSQWVAEELGCDVPVHFSAFHPDYKMRHHAHTPGETLSRARGIAQQHGLTFVYTGNVHDREGDTTRCAHCDTELIVRDWYELKRWNLTADGECPSCKTPLAGVFESAPGTWGAKRQRCLI